MNKKTTLQLLLTGMLGGLLFAPTAIAGRPDTTTEETITLRRADDLIGRDVISRDWQKVGDISDFVFNLGPDHPAVTHAIVTTGGLAGIGGTDRAVPVAALHFDDRDTLRLSTTAAVYEKTPQLPDDQQAYFTSAENMNLLNRIYAISPPTGHLPSSVETYSTMVSAGIYDATGDRLGYLTDAWISLPDDALTFVELRPTKRYLSRDDLRFQIPVQTFTDSEALPGYQFGIDSDDLYEANEADETELVSRLETDDGVVLRVTIKGADDRDRAQMESSQS